MTKHDWFAWQFLVGEWIGQGGGAPGQGGGSLVFSFDLQDRVLIRRNHVDFPPVKDRSAFAHDDLTVIYPDSSGATRADYFDNEGHVIHYLVTIADDGSKITFVSDVFPSSPHFRITYIKGVKEVITIRFEIAPPDDPDGFTVYTEGTASRVVTVRKRE